MLTTAPCRPVVVRKYKTYLVFKLWEDGRTMVYFYLHLANEGNHWQETKKPVPVYPVMGFLIITFY